jgi:hypothetical protein
MGALTRAYRLVGLLVSLLTMPAASLAAQELDIGNLEKSLASFSVEGASLGQTENQLHQALTGNGYQLRNKARRGAQTYAFYQKRDGRAKNQVTAILKGDGKVMELRIAVVNATAAGDAWARIQKVRDVFHGFDTACQSLENGVTCIAYSDTGELRLQLQIGAKTIVYRLANKPSPAAAQQKKALEARRRAAAQRRAARGPAQASQRGVAPTGQARQRTAATAPTGQVQLAAVTEIKAGHPCFSYDRNNARQVGACLDAMKEVREQNRKRVVEAKYDRNRLSSYGLPRFGLWTDLIVKTPLALNSPCYRMIENYGKNLQLYGFSGEDIARRLPACVVLARLHEEEYREPVYWTGCIGKLRSDDAASVRRCITPQMAQKGFVAKYVRITAVDLSAKRCRELQNMWYGGMAGARPELVDDYKTTKLPSCAVVDGTYTAMADRYRQEKGEKRLAQINKARAAREQRQQLLRRAYYEETPERRNQKYSAYEHKAMMNGKLAVPASYPPPTGEEIRLAVMRSIVDRANDEQGAPMVKVMQRVDGVGGSVVTDGHKVYLEVELGPSPVGFEIRYGEVKDMTCNKRSGRPGYMCRYKLFSAVTTNENSPGTANRFTASQARFAAGFLAQSGSTVFNNWFMLTEKGWRQPHTQQQEAEVKAAEKRAAQSIRQRQGRPQDPDAPVLEQALHGLNDAAYADGAMNGAKMVRIK